jgi:hypothetical protein
MRSVSRPFRCFVLTLALLVSGCGVGSSTTSEPEPTPTRRAAQPTLIAGVWPPNVSVGRFSSFDEASQSVGFHVPNAAGFVLNGNVYVMPAVRPEQRPGLTIKSIYRSDLGDEIYFDIVTSHIWEEGPPYKIRPATFGGHEGWIITDDEYGIEFSFDCGHVGEVTLWCVVNAPGIDEAEIEEFVGSIA